MDHIAVLRVAFRRELQRHPFRIEAIVVLPDHLHCIWTLPAHDADFPGRWRRIKSAFSSALPKTERISSSRRMKNERGVWQRRYWEHLIRDERDFNAHVDYIHFNPVKHQHVKRAADWPYSSFHRYVREGLISADWGTDAPTMDIATGE
jgi:putative transposase